MSRYMKGDRSARRGRLLRAGVVGMVMLFGVSSVQASGGCGWGGRDRGHRSWSHDRHWGGGSGHDGWHGHRHGGSVGHTWRAGTLSVDGRCFEICGRQPAHEVARVLRRCGYAAHVERTCDGLRVCVRGCPRVQWRGCDVGARVVHRWDAVTIDFRLWG